MSKTTEHMIKLANLATDMLQHVDDLAGNLPAYLDNNNENWVRDIRTLFNLAYNYRAELDNEKILAERKPLVELKEHQQNPRDTCVDMGQAEPTDQDNYKHIDESVTDQHEQETFGEIDPSGLDAHSPGAKLDYGKPMIDDILAGFPGALWCVAEIGTFGAEKYTLNGWQSVANGISRYRNAAGRHRLKLQMGEINDKDSGLPHRYHEAWNVLAALELELRADAGFGEDL